MTENESNEGVTYPLTADGMELATRDLDPKAPRWTAVAVTELDRGDVFYLHAGRPEIVLESRTDRSAQVLRIMDVASRSVREIAPNRYTRVKVSALHAYVDTPGSDLGREYADRMAAQETVGAAGDWSNDKPQYPATVDGLTLVRRYGPAPATGNPIWERRGVRALMRGDVFRWDPAGDDLVMLTQVKAAAKTNRRMRVWNVQRGGVAEVELDQDTSVRINQSDGYAEPTDAPEPVHVAAESKDTDLGREYADRMAAARAVMPALPDNLNGMELVGRLLDYDPDTWSGLGHYTVWDLKRGEIVSLVLYADALAAQETVGAAGDWSNVKPRRYAVLGNDVERHPKEPSKESTVLTLFDVETGEERMQGFPTDWPVSIRLDLVYLDDKSAPEPREHTPVNTGSTASFTPSEPVGIAEHLIPADPQGAAGVEPRVSLDAIPGWTPPFMGTVYGARPDGTVEVAVADDTTMTIDKHAHATLHYRGVPVPPETVERWGHYGADRWREGVDATLAALGMAQVMPLHQAPLAAPVQSPCGDTSAHAAHQGAWVCPGRAF